MIETVGALLQAFLDHEEKALRAQSVKHGPTIGDMYEGLTRQALDATFAKQSDLRVVHGFARDADGRLSRQLDCMLVTGDGEDVPFTDAKYYDIHNVIAVLETKKTLYKSTIAEGHENLSSLVALSSRPKILPAGLDEVSKRIFSSLTGLRHPGTVSLIPSELQVYHHLAVCQAAVPCRVVLGYHGFGEEAGLRRGFLRHLKLLVGRPGAGPLSFPDLVLNRKVAVAKGVFSPWGVRLEANNRWPVLMTTNHNCAARMVLEVVATKLVQRGLVTNGFFGDDLQMEVMNRLVTAQFDTERNGWKYWHTDEQPVPSSDPMALRVAWEPEFVDCGQAALIQYLGRHLSCPLADVVPDMVNSTQLDQLVRAGIVGHLAEDKDQIALLSTECACAFLPDGRIAVGENNSGRLERWVEARIGKAALKIASVDGTDRPST